MELDKKYLPYDKAEQNQRKHVFFHMTVPKNMHINERKHTDIYRLCNALLIYIYVVNM